MKKPFALIFCLLSGGLLLAGCTDADWDHVMNYGGLQDTDAVQTTPPPQRAASQAAEAPPPAALAAAPPAQAANVDFCRGVAAQDAGSNGFDPATQSRVYARSYAQCLAIYTR